MSDAAPFHLTAEQLAARAETLREAAARVLPVGAAFERQVSWASQPRPARVIGDLAARWIADAAWCEARIALMQAQRPAAPDLPAPASKPVLQESPVVAPATVAPTVVVRGKPPEPAGLSMAMRTEADAMLRAGATEREIVSALLLPPAAVAAYAKLWRGRHEV